MEQTPLASSAFAGRQDLLVRPARERFHSEHGWLDSWHSFSFADHHDPAWMGFGPLRVINDDRIAAGRGFGMHPHRDMEIITVMVEGQLDHQDSIGHRSSLHAGEVQRMSAGTGILHSEINGTDQSCRLLQIWIEPSSRGIPPSYEQRPFPTTAGWTLLVSPEASEGAMTIHRPMRLWRGRPGPGNSLDLPLASGARGWIQMIAGAVDLKVQAATGTCTGRLSEGDGLGLAPGVQASIQAVEEGADLLCFELR
jgi:redox-sensitive bicupin YhaK (pirin superfamily)